MTEERREDGGRPCSVTVFGARVQNWRCTRRGVIERGGKWFCRQHDPEAVKARRAASDAKYDEKARRLLATWKEREEARELSARLVAVRADLQCSLRSGLLFGLLDEPLDDYGKRIVRAIVQAMELPEDAARTAGGKIDPMTNPAARAETQERPAASKES